MSACPFAMEANEEAIRSIEIRVGDQNVSDGCDLDRRKETERERRERKEGRRSDDKGRCDKEMDFQVEL